MNYWWNVSLLPSSAHPGPSLLNPVPAMHVFPTLLQDVPKTRPALKRRLESVSHCVNILIDVPLSCNGRVCLERDRTPDSRIASSSPVLFQHNQILELLGSHSARVLGLRNCREPWLYPPVHQTLHLGLIWTFLSMSTRLLNPSIGMRFEVSCFMQLMGQTYAFRKEMFSRFSEIFNLNPRDWTSSDVRTNPTYKSRYFPYNSFPNLSGWHRKPTGHYPP